MDTQPVMNQSMFTSRTEEWGTPQPVFDTLNAEFHFTLDVCATHDNAKCERYFTKSDDGLSQKWEASSIWMNPPYGKQIGAWMKKAYQESQFGATVVCLVHARTDTKWWHEYAMKADEIRFVVGRIKFDGNSKNGATFPSCIIIFKSPLNSNNFYNTPRISAMRFK